jgi:hypothetical protein
VSGVSFAEKMGDILNEIVTEHGPDSIIARRFALAVNAPELDDHVVAFVLAVDVDMVRRVGAAAGNYVVRWNEAQAAAKKATGQ